MFFGGLGYAATSLLLIAFGHQNASLVAFVRIFWLLANLVFWAADC